MTKYEKEVITKLTRIETKLDSDFRAIHGHDGQKGLIQKHNDLSDRVIQIETSRKTWGKILTVIASILMLLNGICATYIAFLVFHNKPQKKEIFQNESTRNNSFNRQSSRSRESEPETRR